jgi:membrane-associated phospholipid phosphatase
VAIWLFGVYRKDNSYKQKSLAIFFTIISIFIVYAIINLGIPQWRPGATEAVRGGIAPLIPHPIDNSFPSGHALFTGALLF